MILRMTMASFCTRAVLLATTSPPSTPTKERSSFQPSSKTRLSSNKPAPSKLPTLIISLQRPSTRWSSSHAYTKIRLLTRPYLRISLYNLTSSWTLMRRSSASRSISPVMYVFLSLLVDVIHPLKLVDLTGSYPG